MTLKNTSGPIEIPDGLVPEKEQNNRNGVSFVQWLRRLKHFSDKKFGIFSRFMQFCSVGLSGMAIDLFSYKLLLISAIPLPISRAVAIFIAMTWNFYLNRRLTFSYSRKDGFGRQYLKFVLSSGLGAIVSWSISVFLVQAVSYFSQHLFYAAIMGILAGTIINFTLAHKFVFRKPVS